MTLALTLLFTLNLYRATKRHIRHKRGKGRLEWRAENLVNPLKSWKSCHQIDRIGPITPKLSERIRDFF